MALNDHLRNTRCTAKITIDLKRRMRIEQIIIYAAMFPAIVIDGQA